MLFNKSKVRKVNDKKILHKVGKHWVTLSIAMLATMGIGFAATGQAHHISMPATGVVAHATSERNNVTFSNSGNATMPENQTTNDTSNPKYGTISDTSGGVHNIIPNNDLVVGGQGYDVKGTQMNPSNPGFIADGAGNEADAQNNGENLNINLARKDTDTVQFNDNGNDIGNPVSITGPDSYSYNLQSADYKNAGLPTNLANAGHNFAFNNGQHNIDISNHKYAATVEFQNTNNSALKGKKLSLTYTGEGNAPTSINSSDLTDLSGHNLTINPDYSDIKTANQLQSGLKGFTVPDQDVHFDDYTLGGPYNYYEDASNAKNNINLQQDFDAEVQFVDQSGHNVGTPTIVDFAKTLPSDYNSNTGISLYDLNQKNNFVPAGYKLGNNQGNNNALGASDPLYFANYSSGYEWSNPDNGSQYMSANNTTMPGTGSKGPVKISITHDQATATKDWYAGIQFVDANGNKIGGVQNIDTGDSSLNAPSDKVGDRADDEYDASGFIKDANINVPAGYVVDNSSSNNYETATSSVFFEKYTNPAINYIQLKPAYEANVTLKDAATGQIIKGATPITMINNNNLKPASATTSYYGGSASSNLLGIPDGYQLTGNVNNNGVGQGGNPITGLLQNDVFTTNNGADPANSNVTNSKVPNEVVLVSKQNTSTDYAAIQFQDADGNDLGTTIPVNTNEKYNHEDSSTDAGPDLGSFLATHDIIPKGYQLAPSDNNSQQVNYQESENPTITDVQIVPKSANTFHTAIQFINSASNDNIGMPLVVDTGKTSNLGLPQKLSALMAAYGIQAPKGYTITPGQDSDTVTKTGSTISPSNPLAYDMTEGADSNNTITVKLDPVSAPTTNANSNNNQPSNQKHVITNNDVNNAAKNDSKLQTALNNWNAKNGNTKANAQALINAINADNTLNNANNNLNNIINTIKNAENNPSNHGNLDNLLKLYNLYMGLVNSGLFNN